MIFIYIYIISTVKALNTRFSVPGEFVTIEAYDLVKAML